MQDQNRTSRVLIGESFVGEGAEAAHVNTVLGGRDGPVGTAWATALAMPRPGHSAFVTILRPNLPVKPLTLFVNKAAMADERHGDLTWGAAQAGVAGGVADAVADGVISSEEAERPAAHRGHLGQPRRPGRRAGLPEQPGRHPEGTGKRRHRRAEAGRDPRRQARAGQPVLHRRIIPNGPGFQRFLPHRARPLSHHPPGAQHESRLHRARLHGRSHEPQHPAAGHDLLVHDIRREAAAGLEVAGPAGPRPRRRSRPAARR